MEIIPGLHRIDAVGGTNVYLILGDELTLVDTGMPGNGQRIAEAIHALNRDPSELSSILITHKHIDHIGSLAELKGLTGAQAFAHPADIPFITGDQEESPPSGLLMRLLAKVLPALTRFDPAPVEGTLENGDRLDLLNGARVLHVPGHSAGSIALHFPVDSLLICGDAINLRGNRLGPPPRRFSEDMEGALRSIATMATLDFEILCAGHGDPIIGGSGRAGPCQAATG